MYHTSGRVWGAGGEGRRAELSVTKSCNEYLQRESVTEGNRCRERQWRGVGEITVEAKALRDAGVCGGYWIAFYHFYTKLHHTNA